jgi:hypothetical protein
MTLDRGHERGQLRASRGEIAGRVVGDCGDGLIDLAEVPARLVIDLRGRGLRSGRGGERAARDR